MEKRRFIVFAKDYLVGVRVKEIIGTYMLVVINYLFLFVIKFFLPILVMKSAIFNFDVPQINISLEFNKRLSKVVRDTCYESFVKIPC